MESSGEAAEASAPSAYCIVGVTAAASSSSASAIRQHPWRRVIRNVERHPDRINGR
jgi:hypothetical protein